MNLPTQVAKDAVHVGFWRDEDKSLFYGTYLTLGNRYGQALLAFLVLLVTLVGNRAWKITRCAIHLAVSQKYPPPTFGSNTYSPMDSEKRLADLQAQAILRNSSTAPGGLASILGIFAQGMMQRRKCSRHSIKNVRYNLFLALLMFVHWIGFAALGVTTSLVSRGSLVRSSRTPSCGWWVPKGLGFSDDSTPGARRKLAEIQKVSNQLNLNETLNAENYVRSCYVSGSRNLFDCEKLAVKGLGHSITTVDCPFDEGFCDTKDGKAVAFDSGNVSASSFGINWHKSKSLFVRRRNICTVLPEMPFRYSPEATTAYFSELKQPPANATPSYPYIYSYWLMSDPKNGTPIRNHTIHGWPEYAQEPLVPSLELTTNLVGQTNGTSAVHAPIRPRGEYSNATVALVYLASRAVWSTDKITDPFFRFTLRGPATEEGAEYFLLERTINTIACLEVFKGCSSLTNYCTPWQAIHELDGFLSHLPEFMRTSTFEEALKELGPLQMMERMIPPTSVTWNVAFRGQSALQAQNSIFGYTGEIAVADGQWVKELSFWFSMSLARLQHEVYNTIQAPPGLDLEHATNELDTDPELKDTYCGKIKFRSRGYLSLSVAGLGFVVLGAAFFILLSFFEVAMGVLGGRRLKKLVRQWDADDYLSLLSALEQRKTVQDETPGPADIHPPK